jgi:hypothetical protein
MDHVVERVMTSCENYERQGREDIRAKVGQYLEKLASAGHRDVEELTYYGLAYLRILRRCRSPLFELLSISFCRRLSRSQRFSQPLLEFGASFL